MNGTKAAKKKKPAFVDESEDDYMPDIEEVLSGGAGDAGGGGKKKKLSVERIYQKKTQLEHILLRPDTYIGSVEKVTQVTYWSSFQIICLFISLLTSCLQCA